jgi:hypothetical protein
VRIKAVLSNPKRKPAKRKSAWGFSPISGDSGFSEQDKSSPAFARLRQMLKGHKPAEK